MTSKSKTVSRVVKDETFKLKRGSCLAPFSPGVNSRVMAWHTFVDSGDGSIVHVTDGVQRAKVSKENWPEYVKSCEAAAICCDYVGE